MDVSKLDLNRSFYIFYEGLDETSSKKFVLIVVAEKTLTFGFIGISPSDHQFKALVSQQNKKMIAADLKVGGEGKELNNMKSLQRSWKQIKFYDHNFTDTGAKGWGMHIRFRPMFNFSKNLAGCITVS